MRNLRIFIISIISLFLIIACSSPDSRFVGRWQVENGDETTSFVVTKYGDSFLFEGKIFNGVFSKTKDGNLINKKNDISVFYDSKTKRLIIAKDMLIVHCTKVK